MIIRETFCLVCIKIYCDPSSEPSYPSIIIKPPLNWSSVTDAKVCYIDHTSNCMYAELTLGI